MGKKGISAIFLVLLMLTASGSRADDAEPGSFFMGDETDEVQQGDPDESAAALAMVNAFRKYHVFQDVAGLLALTCLDGASADTIENTKKAFTANFRHKIAKIYLEKNVPASVTAGYSMNGVTYRYNLKPVRTLEIWLATGGSGTVNLSLAVGMKDDKYLLATAVPEK